MNLRKVQFSRCFSVLIETLWNVNAKSLSGGRITYIVLIETLWNVNLQEELQSEPLLVLIETLWNVNITKSSVINSDHQTY